MDGITDSMDVSLSELRELVGDGQGGLSCCDSWGRKESDVTEQFSLSLFHMLGKVMLKILQARLQQFVNQELPGAHAGFQRGRRTRDQIVNICWIIEKATEFQKKHLLH